MVPAVVTLRPFGRRRSGPGLAARTPEALLGALLDLPRPDPAAELLTALGVDRRAARERFAGSGRGER